VGYLGFEGVSFNDLWPLFLGIVASTLLALRFFVAGTGGGWLASTAIAAAPAALGFAYLRCVVVGRPPHFKGDLLETALCVRIGLRARPCLSLPVPMIYVAACSACGPGRAADARPPLGRSGP
jgi:hypothetical protein